MPEEASTNQEMTEQDAGAGPPATEQETDSELERLKEAIEVTVESAGVLRSRLSVRIPQATIDRRLDAQFDELRREAHVPGFRPGRAPRRLIEKRFGADVKDELKNKLVAEAYLAAVEKQQLKVLGDPDLEMDKIELPAEGDLSFSCEVEVKPEFELPPLEAIEIRRPKIEITDEDVTRQIDRMRAMRGNYEPAEDGQVRPDDLVIADVTITVDSQVIHQEENAQLHARPGVIDGVPVEKLGQILTGARSGQSRQVRVRLPEDYRLVEHRGKEARIELAIHEVKRLVLPPMDESFLAASGFDSLDELRKWVRSNLEARLDEQVRRAMRNQVYRYLLENTQLEVPPGLSQRQTERAVVRRMLALRLEGAPEADLNKRLDELRTTARQEVLEDLKLLFILDKIADQLGVEVSEEEVNAQIAQIAQAYGRRFDRVRDELIREGRMTALYVRLRELKCVDQLLEKARVVEAEPESQAPPPSSDQSAAEQSDAT